MGTCAANAEPIVDRKRKVRACSKSFHDQRYQIKPIAVKLTLEYEIGG